VKHVKFHLNRFLRRVRIHGGEFDTSARAMYRDEVVYPLQAELRIVRRSTIERKQMSTKTTFKRIALVTVAALGFGVLAIVPSQATVQANSLTLSSATSSVLTGETLTASSSVATLSFLNTNVADTVSVTAYLMSAPAGNTSTPYLALSETTSAQVDTAAKIATPRAVGYVITTQVAYVAGTAATAAVTAKFKVYMNAPSVVGTYVVKLVPAVVAGGGVIDTTGVTLTITVAKNPSTDTVAATATSIITTAADTTSATDVAVTAALTASTAAHVAEIKVGLLNAAGVATTGESYTAIVTSGPGILGSAAQTGAGFATTARGRAIAVQGGHVVTVYPDGSSGVSTISIQSAAGKVLATETLTFFGAATAITATAVKPVVGVSNSASAILVTLKDAAGTTVSNVTTLYVTSSDATKITGAYTSDTVAYSSTNGLIGAAGYLVDLTAIAAGTAKITVGTKASAIATTGLEATAVDIRVGSTTPGSVSVTLDKSSYIPGEKATITVVLKDATGLTLADGTYTSIFATGGITASYSLGAGSETTSATSVDGFALGVKKFSVYMPIAETDVKFSWTTGAVTAAAGTGLPTAAQGVAGSITVAVASSSGSAATAAAEEAMAAASDAFDAALTAAEAAEMAQSIAQEALDAVASLRERMDKRFDALAKKLKKLLARTK
jgi:trimeric autotransporter adhesin